MAWIEVTNGSDDKVSINLDTITYIHRRGAHTQIQSIGTTGTTGLGVIAMESYDQVMALVEKATSVAVTKAP